MAHSLPSYLELGGGKKQQRTRSVGCGVQETVYIRGPQEFMSKTSEGKPQDVLVVFAFSM